MWKFPESLYVPKYECRAKTFITDVTNSLKIMNRPLYITMANWGLDVVK